MKRLIYSLLSLAALFTVASCQPDKLIGGEKAVDDGTLVDATFAVNLGPQTKAFADGTTVDKLYAGLYEITGPDEYTWVADNHDAPETITGGKATVTFTGKIALGKSYKVVFWAQKQKDGSPYSINWTGTGATTVTVTATGTANDEARDAFFGAYETGTVTGSIDLTGSPVTLKRPFSQVNVLVPTANFVDATAAVTSSMTVAQAPTVLNLATKATSGPADWTFTSAAIDEAAFGSYSSTHKYVAMNYVLVDQSAAGAQYDVTFSVTSAAGTPQVATDKQVKNAPLKVNGRTNIVGNIFAKDFNITIPIIIDPEHGSDQVLTTVTVTMGSNPGNAVNLDAGYDPDPANRTPIPIAIGVSHAIDNPNDIESITVNPASVATAVWNYGTGKLDVTPLVANGAAVITIVFKAVTKTEYSAATAQVYVKVGNGQNEELEQVAAPTFTPAAGEYTAAQSVEIACATEGAAIYYTTDGTDPTAASTAYTAAIAVGETMTIKAIAVKEGMADSEIASATYTIAINQSVTFADPKSKEVIIGTNCELGAYAGLPAPTTENLAPNSSLVYSLGAGTTANAFTLTEDGALTIKARGKAEIVATAPRVETQDKVYSAASDTFTLTVKERLTNPSTQATVDGNSIKLTWTTDENAVGYEIQYLLASENVTEPSHTIAIPDGNDGAYTWGPLEAGTYRFHVVAVAPENSFYANSSDVDLIEKTISAPVQPDFTTIAGLKDLLGEESDTFTGTLTDAVVSFVPSANDAIIKDATGSIIYHKNGHGLLQGQTYSGGVTVSGMIYTQYNNYYTELTDINVSFTGSESAVDPQVVTFADLDDNYSQYEDAYVQVVGATSQVTTAMKGDINSLQNGNPFVVYANVAISINEGDIFTAKGTVTKNSDKKELKVWAANDLTVTGHFSVDAKVKNVEASATSATITIDSDQSWSVGNLSSGLSVNSESGTGDASLTFSFDANDDTNNGVVYTATITPALGEIITITINQAAKGAVAKSWKLVTDASSLADGDIIAFGAYNATYNANGASHTDNKVAGAVSSKLLVAIDVTFSSNGTGFDSLPTGAKSFILHKNNDLWQIELDTKYLYVPEKNKIDSQATATDWSITINNNNEAIITQALDETDYTIQYNPNNGSNARFAAYSSSQKKIRIYRYE